MESNHYEALRNRTCARKVLTENFIQDYEKSNGALPDDVTRTSRLAAALEQFRLEGVQIEVEGKRKNLKLRGYNSRAGLPFDRIATIISQGRPIVGSIRIDDSFAELQRNEIYAYDATKAKMTETGEHRAHAVVFIGYGWVEDEETEYLVFLNSYGDKWCDDGIGRVRFEDARDLFTIDLAL